jgi:hypothetical protein
VPYFPQETGITPGRSESALVKTDFFSDKYTQDPYHIETLSHFLYNFPVDFTRDLWVQSPSQMNVHSEHGGG